MALRACAVNWEKCMSRARILDPRAPYLAHVYVILLWWHVPSTHGWFNCTVLDYNIDSIVYPRLSVYLPVLAHSTSFVPLVCTSIQLESVALFSWPNNRILPPSPTNMVDVSPPPGRPKRSVVWHYFMYDQDRNKSICQVEVTPWTWGPWWTIKRSLWTNCSRKVPN